MRKGQKEASSSRHATTDTRSFVPSLHLEVANWGLPLAAISDLKKDEDMISGTMTAALASYSCVDGALQRQGWALHHVLTALFMPPLIASSFRALHGALHRATISCLLATRQMPRRKSHRESALWYVVGRLNACRSLQALLIPSTHFSLLAEISLHGRERKSHDKRVHTLTSASRNGMNVQAILTELGKACASLV